MTLKRIIVVVIVTVLLFGIGRWLHLQSAYAEVEGLTARHSADLASVVSSTVADVQYPGSKYYESVEYFKVFEYSPTQAKVFVVKRIQPTDERAGLPGDRAGVFYYFVFQDGAWTLDQVKSPEFIWSDLGNADGETWPPYR
jgi:hypothetical protein